MTKMRYDLAREILAEAIEQMDEKQLYSMNPFPQAAKFPQLDGGRTNSVANRKKALKQLWLSAPIGGSIGGPTNTPPGYINPYLYDVIQEGAEMERQGFASKKGMPRRAARKLAYAMKTGEWSKALDRYTRKSGSTLGRFGKRLDTAISDFMTKPKSKRKSPWKKKGLSEGAVKASMEDWLTDLPKAAIAELKAKHGKQLAHTGGDGYRDIGTKKTAGLHKGIKEILKKHNVPKLLGSHDQGSSAIQMSFHTFHG